MICGLVVYYITFFVIFLFSIISADSYSSTLSLILFFFLLVPFYLLIDDFNELVFLNNLESVVAFRILLFYSNIISGFIGLFLSIQVLYLYINT